MVQWLGLGAFTAITWIQFLDRELRSPILQDQKTKKQTNKKKLLLFNVAHLIPDRDGIHLGNIIQQIVRPYGN